jgi:predicted SprT family Zn-dependent metalloprotease
MVMSEIEAGNTLRRLMNNYNLHHWRIGFNNRKRGMGLTSYKDKKIYLSRNLINFAPDDVIINTMLHEIAHAIDFERRGRSSHDIRWQSIALQVGAKPSPYVDDDKIEYTKNIKEKYNYVCECCGIVVRTYRRLKNIDNRYCSDCYDRTRNKCKFREIIVG